MAKKIVNEKQFKDVRPALNPEAEENQLISLAMARVKERLINGTATSQEVCHFLRLGSEKERLEKEKLKEENELLKAKTEALKSTKKIEELYSEAMKAFCSYQPTRQDDDIEPEEILQ